MCKFLLSMLFLVIFECVIALSAYANPPLNLTKAKNEVKTYYHSGEYIKDVDAIINMAEMYLQERVNANQHSSQPKRLAMVLDIDETSLSNFNRLERDDFSSVRDLMYAGFRNADATPITPVLRLYNEAITLGIDVFFISFRPDEYRSYTIANLTEAGYHDWKALYLPTQDEYLHKGARKFKTDLRRMLEEVQGYDIILNLGDQDSDLDNGAYADHVEKIPNPLYNL